MYRWPALLVEPIPSIMEELKKNFSYVDNYKYEQSAISDFDGETVMLTIPSDVIERENLHTGYKGMSALYPLRNGFGSDYQRDVDVKSKFGVDIKVNTLTLKSLIDKHNISKIDVLICDAEGYDWKIFQQLDFSKIRPKFIRLEYINLSEEEKKLTIEKFEKNGYVIEIGQNIDGVDRQIYEKIKNNVNTVGKSKISKDLTVVTGLWNINRTGRSFDHYIEHFNKLLDIDANLFIYLPTKHLRKNI